MVVVGTWADAVQAPFIMVPAAKVAGTAAAAMTTHRQCGERLRGSVVELWVMLALLSAPDATKPRVGLSGVTALQLPQSAAAQTAGRPCGRVRPPTAEYLLRMSSGAGAVAQKVGQIADGWRAQRAERQARRHLDRADFAALRDAGLLTMPVPVEAGGLWSGVAASARPLCEIYRSLAGGDASVALVSSMHPAVIAFWLASPEPSQPEWERQRSAVFASALADEQWGTITSEPGSGGDLFKTRATAAPLDGESFLPGPHATPSPATSTSAAAWASPTG